MIRPDASLAALRARLAPVAADATRVAIGHKTLDNALSGGVARAGLHEVFSACDDDCGAASAFALALAMRAGARPLIWVREDRAIRLSGRVHGPGLIELGFDPADLYLVAAPDGLSVLRAGADIARCGAVGAVVIEPHGNARAFDLTASRRLSMAGAASGVLVLALRGAAEPEPSAALTRWRVAAAPSTPLEGDAPGHPAFDVTLLRQRGGIAGIEARLEWNRDTRSFSTQLRRGAPAAAPVGAGEAAARRAA